jgi:hypothetical protein
LQGAAHRFDIAHITPDELSRPMEVRRPIGLGAVYLLDQAIQHTHLMTARDKRIDKVGADEPCSAGD